jgi:signal peptidase I
VTRRAETPADQQHPEGSATRHPRAGRLGYYLQVAVVALVFMMCVRAFLVQSFAVPTGSMEQTLVPGDRILVNRLQRGPSIQRGDIVVFDGTGTFEPAAASSGGGLAQLVRSAVSLVSLSSGADYVKRVVGMPGDRVTCCDATGRLTVNGVAVDEPYLFTGDVPSTLTFDVIVPAGRIWVMGDHRSDSADSRAYLGRPGGGMVPLDDVVGKAWVRYWPLDRLGGLPSAPGLAAVPSSLREVGH